MELTNCSQKWLKSSEKRRRNLIVEACGLEATFTPKWVLESLGRDKDGEQVSVMTGRDGRILWSGKTRSFIHTNGINRKFTPPWSTQPKGAKLRAAKFSYLVGVLAQQKNLPVKVVKPLVRLSLQFWKLEKDALKGIIHKILSCCESTICRRTSAVFTLRTKPVFTTEKPLNRFGLATVPLWDWGQCGPGLPRKGQHLGEAKVLV